MSGPLNNRRGKRSSVGKLRERVKIQWKDESERDESRQVVPKWVDVDTVWAKVEALTGRETFESEHVQATSTHVVEIRGRADITTKHRLIWVTNGGRVLNIVAALPDKGIGDKLTIWCKHEG